MPLSHSIMRYLSGASDAAGPVLGLRGHQGKSDPPVSTGRLVRGMETHSQMNYSSVFESGQQQFCVWVGQRVDNELPSGSKTGDMDLGLVPSQYLYSELIPLQHVTEQQHPGLSCQECHHCFPTVLLKLLKDPLSSTLASWGCPEGGHISVKG